MRFAAILLTAGLMVCYAQPGQGPGAGNGPGNGPGNRPGSAPNGTPAINALQTYLDLTDAQLMAFQSIHESTRTAVQPILEQIRTKAMALRDAVKNNDTATAGQLQVDIQGLRDQIQQIQSNGHDQVVAQLTADQKDKLTTLEDAAKVQQEVRQAIGVGLIEPPEGEGPGRGPGRGPRGFGGPGRGAGRFGPPPEN